MAKRILFLADATSAHTKKWVQSFVNKGFEVGLFSFFALNETDKKEYNQLNNFTFYPSTLSFSNANSGSKLSYLSQSKIVKKIIDDFKPDFLHAHYASSYGLIGALTGFHPFYISVWGTDVFVFPKSNSISKFILKYNLKKADAVFSTSKAMAKETNLYTNKPIEITPFGIDTNVFYPNKIKAPYFESADFIFGTIKTMEENYANDIIIKAFAQLKKQTSKNIKLLMIGGGSLIPELKKLCIELGIENHVHFTGELKQALVAEHHNMIDCFLNTSINESFGVSVVEAMACGVPIIASASPGMLEVTNNGSNAFLVPIKNIEKTLETMKIVLDWDEEVEQKKKAALKYVLENYVWSNTIDLLIKKHYN